MKRLKKADANFNELIKKIDKQKLVEAAQKEYEHGAEHFAEEYYDDHDLIDWEYCKPKKEIAELYEDYMDDFSDSYVYEYMCEATGLDELNDEQIEKILEQFGCKTIKEFILENGYTDNVEKSFSKMEEDMIDYLRENYPDECRKADEIEYFYYKADQEYDDRF